LNGSDWIVLLTSRAFITTSY